MMMEQELRERAEKWSRVKSMLDAGASVQDIVAKEPWLQDKQYVAATSTSTNETKKKSNDDFLTPAVVDIMQKATGLGNAEAINNIFLLVSKSEQDNEDPKKAFLDDKGDSLYGYCAALPWDWKQRGVTMGLVGFTTANDGKDGQGDAPALFKVYKSLGGEDLMPYCQNCTKSKSACQKLIKKVRSLATDPNWIQAQWQQLVSPGSDDGAYMYHTIQAWKKVGVDKPSALAIASVFDASLNGGNEGKYGGCSNLIKVAVHGNEDATLQKFHAWRREIAGEDEMNDPPINGTNRVDMFEKLRKAKAFAMTGPADAKAIKEAIAWEMK